MPAHTINGKERASVGGIGDGRTVSMPHDMQVKGDNSLGRGRFRTAVLRASPSSEGAPMICTLFLLPALEGSGGQSASIPTRQPANATTLMRGVYGEPCVNWKRSMKPVMNWLSLSKRSRTE